MSPRARRKPKAVGRTAAKKAPKRPARKAAKARAGKAAATPSLASLLLRQARSLKGDPARAEKLAREWITRDAAVVGAALPELWPGIPHAADRQQILKAFFHARHPAAAALLDLGMSDADARVRGWACEFLGGLAFRDFRPDPELYPRWRDLHKGLRLEDILRVNARDFVARLRRTLPHELPDAARELVEFVRAANAPFLVEAGLVDLLGEWIAAGLPHVAERALRTLARLPVERARLQTMLADTLRGGSDEAVATVLRHLPEFPVEEAFCREHVEWVATARPGLRAAAVRALGRPAAPWCVDLLVPHLSDPADGVVVAAAEALGRAGDRRAIPALVAALQCDTSAGRRTAIATLGLEPLTGVAADPAHDAEWWGEWLAEYGVAHRPAKARRARVGAGKRGT